LSSFRGADGLHVFVRSLNSTQPVADVSLTLIARNNTELGTASTDALGHARFDPGLLRGKGGAEPALLLASQALPDGQDFAFMDLTRAAFDLSDRGVSGRPAPGPLDAYLYSERGVYRPGETVQLMTLLRDERGFKPAQNIPLTLTLVRPDQVEVDRFTLRDEQAGAYHTQLLIPANAYTGSWQARVYADPAAEPIGVLEFLVEDFVPQQLKLALSADRKLLRPDQTATITLQGDYLYGAPAANLRTDAEVVLREDPQPFPDYADFHFGRVEESFESKRIGLDAPITDDAGQARIALQLDERPDTSR
ncbi:MAG: alpha-2-macroglobulin family protein, partial [Candidatus Competibacteraceae bacterium]|nr:alpha-2-macroglobulin family protein [Candidatus Competibacteraceae bacterium]